ncbi:PKD domain-containing protein [Empedobacter tilapiae]|uniref:PKD domain-containing protein n=1 Tax=Empedobacter tilapiae TaxID=2491114 RepID=A0A4Z1BEC5_9FLAO|nr:PKD domain-containing protein [Empedobacter tilapiae]TGN26067.1 PKD domain-containing protein [Empedobacter tilapiae]
MKTILNYILSLLIGLSFFQSCASEESIAIEADFEITIQNNDYSVPVKVDIKNKTIGADTFNWTFDGATEPTSTQKNPKTVVYTEPGTYTIKLEASNKDGIKEEKTVEFKVDAAMKVDFEWIQEGSDTAPVKIQLKNLSKGVTKYLWEFENGTPSTSSIENPIVVFNQAGQHKIKLTIQNGREEYSVEKTIEVKNAMNVDFDWTVDFIDQDYETPVTLNLSNKTTQAISYEWYVNNSATPFSTVQHPTIVLTTIGLNTIKLVAKNDKESKVLEKQVEIKANKNLLTFEHIKLGINTAHSSLGSFFSSQLGQVINKEKVNGIDGALIDFAYFGLSSAFDYNEFLSPDQVQTKSFNAIKNAIHTKIINSQELVGTQLSVSQFDAIDNGSDFNRLTITESSRGKTAFDDKVSNRVVLFETADGRKGAVKIEGFINNGKESYIMTTIKVQKPKNK